MNQVILRTVSRVLLGLLFIVSVFVLLRGHNDPGGGFIGGLLAASSLVVYAVAFGPDAARQALRLSPQTLLGGGLVLSFSSTLGALVVGEPWLTSQWAPFKLPGIGKLSTVLMFDVGVYLVVFGAALAILLPLMEAEQPTAPAPSAGDEETP